MNIYTSEKALPYVYRLDNPKTGEIYIGYREINTIPSHLDLPEYRTSSKYVGPRFEEFNWTILAEFFIGDDAYDHEQLSIFEEWDNPLILNKSCYYGKQRFKNISSHSDEAKAKISAAGKGRKRLPFSDEHKANMSASAKGKPKSAEHIANMVATHIGIPLSAEHKAKISATATGKTRGPRPPEIIAKIVAAKKAAKLLREIQDTTLS